MADNLLKLLGRILVATIFVWQVYDMGTRPSATIADIGRIGLPYPGVFYAFTMALVGIASVCVILGWKTKHAALLLFCWLLPVTYLFHFDLGNKLQLIMLLKNSGLLGALLLLTASGPGRYSLQKS